MKILGLSAFYHDSAAALVIDGLPVAAVQEERLSRRKNDAEFPMQAIEWCLDHASLEPEELDAVIFYERPALKFDRVLMTLLRSFPHSWRAFPNAMNNMLGEKLWVRGVIAAQLGVDTRRIHFTDHHLSHADRRPWEQGRGRCRANRTVARGALSSFARPLLFGLYRLSGLQGQ
jgi:carbamoyltransferase